MEAVEVASTGRRRLPQRLDGVATLLVLAGLSGSFAWLQGTSPDLVSGDSYFHARAAQQLAEHGVSRRFPQAAFSTWADTYSDKDFLFHLALRPFVRDEAQLVPRVKRAVVVFGTALLVAVAWAAHALGARAVWLWLLALAGAGPWLWLHLAQARPHLLGIPLLLIELVLLVRGRWRWLALTAGLHVLAHTSFVLLPALAVGRVLADRFRGEPASWRGLASVAIGFAVASLLHPYFPNNLTLTWDQVVEVARNLWGAESDIPADIFGAELGRLSSPVFTTGARLWAPVALGAALLVAGRRRAPLSVAALTVLLASAALLVASALTMRFFAFFLPTCALAGAVVWTELAQRVQLGSRLRTRPASAVVVAAVLAALALASAGAAARNVRATADQIRGTVTVAHAKNAAAFLDRAAKPHDVVFHAFWRPFPSLYFHRPDGRYTVALDPIYLYRFDPELFSKMLAVYRGEADDPWDVVAGDFGARWVFVPKLRRFDPMFQALSRDARFRPVFLDQWSMVFDARRPARARSSALR